MRGTSIFQADSTNTLGEIQHIFLFLIVIIPIYVLLLFFILYILILKYIKYKINYICVPTVISQISTSVDTDCHKTM